MKIKLSFLAAFIAASPTVYSQSNNDLETISVLGSRAAIDKRTLAGSVSFLDEDTIKASGASTVVELLRTFASVNVSQSGPTGTLSELRFRGSESNHILVLIDGVEVNDIGQGGLVDFAHIVVADIERIELLRGPQSALWGTSAVSGVISITTKRASEPQQLSANIALGTQATKELGLSYSSKSDKLSFAINLNHLSTDGDNISRNGDEDDGYRNSSLSAKVQYDINDAHQLTSNVRIVEFTSSFDAIDFGTTGLPTDADNLSEGEQLNYLLRWLYAPKANNWSQSLSYQLSRNESENYTQDIFSGSTLGETERLTWLHYFDLSKGAGYKKNFLNIGVDAVEEDFQQAGPVSFGDPNQSQSNTTISALADGQIGLGEALYLSASLRRDNSDEFEDASSFRLGLSWQAMPNLKIFLSRGKAIKNPSFTERFGFFPGTFQGNPNLTPESSFSNEVGLEYAPTDQIDIQLTHFNTELEDEINGFVFDPTSGAFTANNLEETSTRKGFELSLKGYLDRLTWSASYAYLDAKAPTEIELRRSRHTGSVTLNYTINDKNNVYVQGDYTGSKLDRFFPPFPASAELVELGAYWLLSANYGYKITDRLMLNLRAENLLNEDYEDVFGFVGQKRRITLNLRYQLN